RIFPRSVADAADRRAGDAGPNGKSAAAGGARDTLRDRLGPTRRTVGANGLKSNASLEASMTQPVIIQWSISSFFGWGVYGLNLGLHWAGDPEIEPVCAAPIDAGHISVDPLRERAL